MDWLVDIIKSGNALNILLVGILIFILIKSKALQVHTEHIKLGAHEDERAIMRRQLEYVRVALKSSTRAFPKTLNPDKTKNVVHSLCDLFEDMIVFNHIKDDKEYIGVKQLTVYNTVLSLTNNDFFLSDEFKVICDTTVEDIIKALVRIRKTYKSS